MISPCERLNAQLQGTGAILSLNFAETVAFQIKRSNFLNLCLSRKEHEAKLFLLFTKRSVLSESKD